MLLAPCIESHGCPYSSFPEFRTVCHAMLLNVHLFSLVAWNSDESDAVHTAWKKCSTGKGLSIWGADDRAQVTMFMNSHSLGEPADCLVRIQTRSDNFIRFLHPFISEATESWSQHLYHWHGTQSNYRVAYLFQYKIAEAVTDSKGGHPANLIRMVSPNSLSDIQSEDRKVFQVKIVNLGHIYVWADQLSPNYNIYTHSIHPVSRSSLLPTPSDCLLLSHNSHFPCMYCHLIRNDRDWQIMLFNLIDMRLLRNSRLRGKLQTSNTNPSTLDTY